MIDPKKPTTKFNVIVKEIIGKCHAHLEQTFLKVMTSVLLHFYSHYPTVVLESRQEIIFHL